MTLNILNDFISWLDRTMKQLEQFVENHFDNPLLWILIIGILLLIVSIAYGSLSKNK